MEELPTPEDERVELRAVPAFTAAVIRFSGWATDGKSERKREELMEQLQLRGLAVIGDPVLNQYNPPWTLPFLRRNEVMVPVAWPLQATQSQPGDTGGDTVYSF